MSDGYYANLSHQMKPEKMNDENKDDGAIGCLVFIFVLVFGFLLILGDRYLDIKESEVELQRDALTKEICNFDEEKDYE